MPKTYIVIVNWNGWQDTLECLDSLQAINSIGFTILLCDNGSNDHSLVHFRNWATHNSVEYCELIGGRDSEFNNCMDYECKLILINNLKNLGFAGANNVALRYILARDDFEYVWLLNNDTVAHPDALIKLLERMQEKPDAGMCGSTLLHYDQPEKVQAMGGGYYCKWIGLPWHLGRLKKSFEPVNIERVEEWMNYVVGASMLVSRDFLKDVGLMCEDYFLYFEETDWAIRAKGRFSLSYAPKSIVYHKIGASIGTSSNPKEKSYLCNYYNIKNRLFFTRKFFPAALPSVFIILLGTLLTRIALGKWDRVLMIIKLLVDCGKSTKIQSQNNIV